MGNGLGEYSNHTGEMVDGSEISTATQILRKLNSEMEEVLSRLGDKLSPVMTPERPSVCDEGKGPAPVRSPLADELNTVASQLRDRIQYVEYLYSRIDL